MIIEKNYNIPVDFSASGRAEIVQNVRTILSTPKFSVPLDREFGLDATLLDKPLPVAKAQITAAIIAAINKYEPRVKVSKVFFESAAIEGVLQPKVQVVIND